MVNRAKNFLVQQKIAVGIVIVIIVGVVGYFSTLVVTEAPLLGNFVEGEHYTLLENPRRVRTDKIEVMEFFSYGCIHCYNFDPELSDWAESNSDKINFIRTPAISNDLWRLLGRNYYTMEKLGIVEKYHMPFFREVHDVKRNFSSPKRLSDYFDGKGTTSEEYTKVFNSLAVSRKMTVADQMGRRLLVSSVPTIIVHGKYMVRITRSVGISRMLEVMDFLVDKELAEKQAISTK
jgi:thiol:disulfide interchange protein DsbA